MKKRELLKIKYLFRLILILFPIFFSINYARAASSGEVQNLKIGALFSLTGPGGLTGKLNMDGAMGAAEWINEKGGITIKGQRYMIKVIGEDDKSTGEGAVAAANKLVHKDKIKFIIGPLLPHCAIAISPITEEAKVICLNVNGIGVPEQMNPNLKFTFATYKNRNHIPFIYSFFVENYSNAKKVAIMGPDDPAGQVATPLSEKEAKGRQLEVVFAERYPFGTKDFYPILTKALGQKPEAIDMTVGIAPWFAAIIKQARQLGFVGPMFSWTPTGDIYFVRDIIGKDFADNIFFVEPDFKNPRMPPIIKEAAKKIMDKFGTEIKFSHVAGWEALWCMVQAIEAAQTLDTLSVVQTWEKMKNIETMYGKGRMGGKDIFGINHVIIKPIPITRLKKGKVEFIKFINP